MKGLNIWVMFDMIEMPQVSRSLWYKNYDSQSNG